MRYVCAPAAIKPAWHLRAPVPPNAAFAVWPGCFFAEAAPGVLLLSRGDGRLWFVRLHDGATQTRRVRARDGGDVVVKGVCRSAAGLFLWVHGAAELLRVPVEGLTFEDSDSSEGEEDTDRHADPATDRRRDASQSPARSARPPSLRTNRALTMD